MQLYSLLPDLSAENSELVGESWEVQESASYMLGRGAEYVSADDKHSSVLAESLEE